MRHCPDEVVKAIQDQAAKYIHTSFNVVTYEPYIELCETLCEILPHGKKNKAMLVSTGAEAVENAIKIARQATGRQAVLCFTEAYYGRTMMAMMLTSKINYKTNCGPFAKSNHISSAQLTTAFLHPPLYNTTFKEGFGTLYTAAYKPESLSVHILWPQKTILRTFDYFAEETIPVHLHQSKRPVLLDEKQNLEDIFAHSDNWQYAVVDSLVRTFASKIPKQQQQQQQQQQQEQQELRTKLMPNGHIAWEVVLDYWHQPS